MPIRDDLPEGVAVCECCGELYTDELTLSEMCEICDFYEYEDIYDFNDRQQQPLMECPRKSVGASIPPK